MSAGAVTVNLSIWATGTLSFLSLAQSSSSAQSKVEAELTLEVRLDCPDIVSSGKGELTLMGLEGRVSWLSRDRRFSLIS